MNVAFFALIGGLLGYALLSPPTGGFVAGAAFGALLAWMDSLHRRVCRLEADARRGAVHPAAATFHVGPSAATPNRAALTVDAAAGPDNPDSAPGISTPRGAEPALRHDGRPPAHGRAVRHTKSTTREEAASTGARPPRHDNDNDGDATGQATAILSRALLRLRTWLTTGNAPVKVGVLLSLFGVGFLVREAMERDWLVMPVELRLAAVALFGLSLLALGWRLRHTHRVYALSIQGGGIAMLYLTVFASFALYALLPGWVVFTALLVLTTAAVALAVLQDARSLAVGGIIGGFLAPLLTTEGPGDHVVLLSYYLVLNVAIASVAWFRAWRQLNVLGFLFTFGIGTYWGYEAYRPEHYASTQPFLLIFVLLYSLIPVLFALRRRPELRSFVDGTLVFGTPIAGFALQARLLGETDHGLAFSALALAGWYAALAAWLHARRDPAVCNLRDAQTGLAAVFVALAVPLALGAGWTSAAWAVQGAALVWLSVRQQRLLPLLAGTLLQLGAGAAYLLAPRALDAVPLFNGHFLGGVLLVAAGLYSSNRVDCWPADRRTRLVRRGAAGLLVWATGWWTLTSSIEIARHLSGPAASHLMLLVIAVTAAAATFAARRLGWARLSAVGLLAGAAIVFGVLWGNALFVSGSALAHWGWLAWPALLGAHLAAMKQNEGRFPRLRGTWHIGVYCALALLLASEAAWQVSRVSTDVWTGAAAIAAVAVFVLATLQAYRRVAWPLGAHWGTYRLATGAVLAALSAVAVVASVLSRGDPAPLPYVPLLNPLELSVLLTAVAVAAWTSAQPAEPNLRTLDPRLLPGGIAALGLLVITSAVARTVHHWGGVAWQFDALFASGVLQAALSLVWGVAAFAGMVLGARRGHREIWVASATLMAVVVAKLFAVDLGNAGTVSRVVSFLGVGLLLLVVGYFAPAPPRDGATARAGATEGSPPATTQPKGASAQVRANGIAR